MKSLAPLIPGIDLYALSGNDGGIWTLDRIRFATKYPNWSIVTDCLEATRNYDLALSFGTSIFLRSFDFADQMPNDELERIHHITSTFILNMLDKADLWSEYLVWFSFLRYHTNNYLRYDLHILSHTGTDIEEFIDDKGDEYTWVHNMYVYNHRRRTIERKLARKNAGNARKSDMHHPKADLSPMDLRCRLENVFSFYRFKLEQAAFWQSFWKHKNG